MHHRQRTTFSLIVARFVSVVLSVGPVSFCRTLKEFLCSGIAREIGLSMMATGGLADEALRSGLLCVTCSCAVLPSVVLLCAVFALCCAGVGCCWGADLRRVCAGL